MVFRGLDVAKDALVRVEDRCLYENNHYRIT